MNIVMECMNLFKKYFDENGFNEKERKTFVNDYLRYEQMKADLDMKTNKFNISNLFYDFLIEQKLMKGKTVSDEMVSKINDRYSLIRFKKPDMPKILNVGTNVERVKESMTRLIQKPIEYYALSCNARLNQDDALKNGIYLIGNDKRQKTETIAKSDFVCGIDPDQLGRYVHYMLTVGKKKNFLFYVTDTKLLGSSQDENNPISRNFLLKDLEVIEGNKGLMITKYHDQRYREMEREM